MRRLGAIVLMLSSLSFIFAGVFMNIDKEKQLKAQAKQAKIELEIKEKQRIKDEHLLEVKNAYNSIVKTKNDSDLYIKQEEEYIKAGSVSKDYILELGEIEIDYETKYFPIKGTDYFIEYNNVETSEARKEGNLNFKKYIPFNENIVTKEDAKLYREDGTYISYNKSLEFKVLVKDTDKYSFDYNDELYSINKDDVKKIKKVTNSNEYPRVNIRTLTYHTVFNPETEKCTNESICHPISQFDSHMKYLNENNYLTLTMKELEMFLDKKIQIPQKSIVITLDDGDLAHNAVNIANKYKVYITYFMITSWFKIPEIESQYVDYQSHTHNMHNNWKCPGGNQGGQILCEDKTKILEDLNKNKEILGGDVFAFAYPFFDFNERAMTILKEAGIRLAFIGQAQTDGYSDFYTNRLLLRRKTIFSTDTLQTFISRLA